MMKTKKIQYTIEEPCHADWEQMKPEAQGRFCESCSTSVVDFSGMSDYSIVSYMESNKNESVCGRFTAEQLNKDYQWIRQQHSLSFDLRAVVLGLALTTFSALPSQAQNQVAMEQHDSIEITPNKMVYQGLVTVTSYDHSKETFVSGKIRLSGTKYHLVKVVLLDGSNKELLSVVPDKNGGFRISLDWSKNPAGILVSAPGHYPQTISFSKEPNIDKLVMTLREKKMVKGKVLPKKM